MKTTARLIALLAGFTLAAAATAAEGPARQAQGPVTAEWLNNKLQTCASCHGKDGLSTQPMFPVLAGQYEDYLARALHEYRDGGRKNSIMAPQAKDLSDAQIEALAHYFAQLEGPLKTLPRKD
ncbi:MAG: cytochrome c [Gammaproteobacteria bacterium]|jgi:cytochrome c553